MPAAAARRSCGRCRSACWRGTRHRHAFPVGPQAHICSRYWPIQANPRISPAGPAGGPSRTAPPRGPHAHDRSDDARGDGDAHARSRRQSASAMFERTASGGGERAVPVGQARRHLSALDAGSGSADEVAAAGALRCALGRRRPAIACCSWPRTGRNGAIADLAIMTAGGDHGAGLHHQHDRRPSPTC